MSIVRARVWTWRAGPECGMWNLQIPSVNSDIYVSVADETATEVLEPSFIVHFSLYSLEIERDGRFFSSQLPRYSHWQSDLKLRISGLPRAWNSVDRGHKGQRREQSCAHCIQSVCALFRRAGLAGSFSFGWPGLSLSLSLCIRVCWPRGLWLFCGKVPEKNHRIC